MLYKHGSLARYVFLGLSIAYIFMGTAQLIWPQLITPAIITKISVASALLSIYAGLSTWAMETRRAIQRKDEFLNLLIGYIDIRFADNYPAQQLMDKEAFKSLRDELSTHSSMKLMFLSILANIFLILAVFSLIVVPSILPLFNQINERLELFLILATFALMFLAIALEEYYHQKESTFNSLAESFRKIFENNILSVQEDSE